MYYITEVDPIALVDLLPISAYRAYALPSCSFLACEACD